MKVDILKKVDSFVSVGDRIAVAVSGGEDSMVLLYALTKISKDFSYFVVNVEHGIRGEASKNDSKFVEDFCKERGIEFLGFTVDAKKRAEDGETLEEAGRNLRYQIFKTLIDSGKCNKVMLAHHRRDQAETVLMRIIRGTGVTGLSGMQGENNGYVRPLLDVRKEDIVEFRCEHNIPFVYDETNGISDTTRNILRNEVLPILSKISADAEGGLNRLSQHAKETEDYLKTLDIDVEYDRSVASINLEKEVHPYLLKRGIRRAFALLGINKDIEERHINIILDFLSAENGQSLDMPYNVRVSKEYGKLVFSKISAKERVYIPFLRGEVCVLGERISITLATRNDIGTGALVFDISKIPESAVIRTREEQDVFKRFRGGTKSLGDYLTDIKVPKRLRDDLLLVADGKKVLMIIGLEISDQIKIDNNTKDDDIYKVTKEG